MSLLPPSTMGDSIHGTLVQRAGGAPDAIAMVAAVSRTWQFMAAQLEPVIGVRGVDVLLDRALHLTSKKFPWLVHTTLSEVGVDPVTRLQSRFVNRDATEAAEAGGALLVTFTELLSSLIGEPLTERLLATVWLAASPPPEQDFPHA